MLLKKKKKKKTNFKNTVSAVLPHSNCTQGNLSWHLAVEVIILLLPGA
jgi:hypothetical protein